jgi:CDGSH-type Zn-finger protein
LYPDKPARQEAHARKVTVMRDGPYPVSGGLLLAKEFIVFDPAECCPTAWAPGEKYPDKEAYALCRCGQSGNKPSCDGSHIDCGFDDGDKSLKQRGG